MNKAEFIDALCNQLIHLPEEKILEARFYYSGVIDAKISGGMREEEAVSSLGGAEKTALEFINNTQRDKGSHRISKKIKSMPPVLRVVLSGLLSAACFLTILAVWAVLISFYIVTAVLGLCGILSVIGGLAMCFVRTVPVGICVIGLGLILGSIMFLLISPAGILSRVCKNITAAILGRVRSLLAKEALAV